jgi:hypothetical protein
MVFGKLRCIYLYVYTYDMYCFLSCWAGIIKAVENYSDKEDGKDGSGSVAVQTKILKETGVQMKVARS